MADSANSAEPIDLPNSESDDEVTDSHQMDSKKKNSNGTSLNKPDIHFKRQRKLTSDVWELWMYFGTLELFIVRLAGTWFLKKKPPKGLQHKSARTRRRSKGRKLLPRVRRSSILPRDVQS